MANSGNTFLAFLTGAAIGSVVGVLYAPEKGEDTRKKLSSEAKKAKVNLDHYVQETTEYLNESAKKTKLSFEEKMEESLSTASNKADGIIEKLEARLEELKTKNAKFKKNVKEEQVKTTAKKTTS